MIEELEDIVEGIAADLGVYGAEKRSVFVSNLTSRIRDAVALPARSGGDLSPRGAVALKVLTAWLSNPEVFWDDPECPEPDADYYTRMAKHAYMAADAFLSAGASAPENPALGNSVCLCNGLGCFACSGTTGQSGQKTEGGATRPGAQRARRKK